MAIHFKSPCKYTLSANEIRQYSECARKRYYASRDCLALRPRKINKNLEIGRAIHLALQYYYTTLNLYIQEAGLVSPTKEQVEALLDTVATYQLPSALEGGAELQLGDTQIYDTVVRLYMPYIVDDLVHFEVLGCEMAFHMHNWPVEDVLYHGNIDMVVKDRETGLIWFFEHKTCSNFRPEIYNRFDIQLHIYDAYGKQEYGEYFGGMILNELKKAKTERGFGVMRLEYPYTDEERDEFFYWIKKKTEGLISPNNRHEPCNSYMGCKMCEYAPICMKFGYSVPKTTAEIADDPFFVTEEGEIMFAHNPRETEEESE